jgi:hypothetical protein
MLTFELTLAGTPKQGGACGQEKGEDIEKPSGSSMKATVAASSP